MQDSLRDSTGDELANVLDWWGMVSDQPGILQTKSQRLQLTYVGRHLDTEQMEDEQRRWYLGRLNAVHKILDSGWALDSDWWHEPDISYPLTDWDATDGAMSDRLIDTLRRVDFEEHPRHESMLYLTLSWAPPEPTQQLMKNMLVTRPAQREITRQIGDELALFREGTERYGTFLRPLMEHLTPLDADGMCTYLHQCISWDRHAVQCPELPYDLDWQLSSDVWKPGQPPQIGDTHVQPLTIKTWGNQLRTFLPEALSKLPFPCRYHTRWEPLSAQTADSTLTWAEKRWATAYKSVSKLLKSANGQEEPEDVAGRDVQDGAITAGQSIVDFRRRVRRGEDVAGQLNATVVVWGEALGELDTRIKAVSEAMFQQGLVVRIEKPNASIQWLATLPGHVSYGFRGRILSTTILTGITTHCQMWSGPREDPHLHAPPLLMASTDGAPFRVVTHVGDLGHVGVFGPSRTGKSGFFGLCMSQMFRYAGARGIVFDRDYSLKAATVLRGGRHYALGAPGSPRLHMFAEIDTEVHQQWAALQLETMLTGEGVAPTPDERREIWRMIEMMATLPKRQRTIGLMRQLLQVQRLKVGLEPFCTGGEYAFCDGNNDQFAWENRLLCFEMSALLKKPRALQAVMGYIFHQLDTHCFTGDPVYIFMDEARWPFDVPQIRQEAEVYLKAGAKKNVSFWLAAQEMYDLQKTEAWQAILGNVPTKILLPNYAAMDPSVYPYYKEMGIPDFALRQLTVAEPYRDYLYHSRYGTRLFQCRLSPVERLLCAASSLEELEVLDRMAALFPPEQLPAAWLRHWGYPLEASFLEPQKGNVCATFLSLSVSPSPSVSSVLS